MIHQLLVALDHALILLRIAQRLGQQLLLTPPLQLYLVPTLASPHVQLLYRT
jgi:hypothetical protein